MRSAGCTFNDLIDRDIDPYVSRTKMRPLASHELSPRQGMIYFFLQCLGGLVVLLFLPRRCWPLSLLGLALLTIYPFMKRVTHWPQLVLGFAFNLGVIFGAVAVLPYESINWPAVFSLYGAGISWTMGYDTIYALQDKDDDLKIGVKSTAIYFGERVKIALSAIYALLFLCLLGVGYWANGGLLYYVFLCFIAGLTTIVLYRFQQDSPAQSLKVFNANTYLGWLIWGALLTLSL